MAESLVVVVAETIAENVSCCYSHVRSIFYLIQHLSQSFMIRNNNRRIIVLEIRVQHASSLAHAKSTHRFVIAR